MMNEQKKIITNRLSSLPISLIHSFSNTVCLKFILNAALYYRLRNSDIVSLPHMESRVTELNVL